MINKLFEKNHLLDVAEGMIATGGGEPVEVYTARK